MAPSKKKAAAARAAATRAANRAARAAQATSEEVDELAGEEGDEEASHGGDLRPSSLALGEALRELEAERAAQAEAAAQVVAEAKAAREAEIAAAVKAAVAAALAEEKKKVGPRTAPLPAAETPAKPKKAGLALSTPTPKGKGKGKAKAVDEEVGEELGALNPLPCAACLRSAISGKGTGACHARSAAAEEAARIKGKCFECAANGRACKEAPKSAAGFIPKLLALLAQGKKASASELSRARGNIREAFREAGEGGDEEEEEEDFRGVVPEGLRPLSNPSPGPSRLGGDGDALARLTSLVAEGRAIFNSIEQEIAVLRRRQ